MTDFNMLEDIMKRSGATVEAVAKAANIFQSGGGRIINTSMDSGFAMIRDIIAHI